MGDWDTASVAAVAAAAAAGEDADAAVLRLGHARAVAGVGIAEGLDDLDRLWIMLGDPGAPTGATRAFAEGWAEAVAAPAARPARDPSSGLATADVLRIRVADLQRTGAAESSALIVVTAVDPALPRFARHLEVAAMGAIITEALPGAETPVRLTDDRVAALAPRDGAFDEGVIRLRRAIQRRTPGAGDDALHVTALPRSGDVLDAWSATR